MNPVRIIFHLLAICTLLQVPTKALQCQYIVGSSSFCQSAATTEEINRAECEKGEEPCVCAIKCTTCKTGTFKEYAILSGVSIGPICHDCDIDNCVKCHLETGTRIRCEECAAGYKLSNETFQYSPSIRDIGKTCIQMICATDFPNCDTCDSPSGSTKCTVCDSSQDYIIGYDGQCHKCDVCTDSGPVCSDMLGSREGCNCTASNFADPCQSCLTTSDLHVSYCTSCTNNQLNKCSACQPGYDIDLGNNVCKAVECNISNCSLCSTSNICMKCVYYESWLKLYLHKESNSCYQYLPKNAEVTTHNYQTHDYEIACKYDHFFQNSSFACLEDCALDANCLSCSDHVCSKCNGEYGLNLGNYMSSGRQCILCPFLTSLAVCLECNENICTQCEREYYLDNETNCEMCPKNCTCDGYTKVCDSIEELALIKEVEDKEDEKRKDKKLQDIFLIICFVFIGFFILIAIGFCIFKLATRDSAKVHATRNEKDDINIFEMTMEVEDLTEREIETTCSICLEDIIYNKRSITLPCGHNSFHAICIRDWAREHRNCPLCRDDLTALYEKC